MNEYFKHLLLRTPLEKPAKNLKVFFKSRKSKQKPELYEIHQELPRIEQALKLIIKNNSNCIDIGCHTGSMLSDILRLAPDGNHIAFEPIPYKVNWLKQKFPEVDIKQMALSDHKSEAIFYINKTRSGFSGLKADKTKRNENLEKIRVQCERLDDVLNPDYRVDFMKVDVEGAELALFRGAKTTLSRYQPILLFECSRYSLNSFGFTSEQIFNCLTQEYSYLILLIKDFLSNGEPLNFEKFDKALDYPFQAFNFIAVPQRS